MDKNEENEKIRLLHCSYEQMGKLVEDDWSHHHPRSNTIWIQYIIRKLVNENILTEPREAFREHSRQVVEVLWLYHELMDESVDLFSAMQTIMDKPRIYNDCVRIYKD